jgi:hypothetical protein
MFSQRALAGPEFGRENIVHNYDWRSVLAISICKIASFKNGKPHHLKKTWQDGFFFHEQGFPKERGLRIWVHAIDQRLAR